MFIIYSPELKQTVAATRFSDIAAHLAGFWCEYQNTLRGAPQHNPISMQVFEVPVVPLDFDIEGRRAEPPPKGRLVGTVKMVPDPNAFRAWVTEDGWRWGE